MGETEAAHGRPIVVNLSDAPMLVKELGWHFFNFFREVEEI
jgi:hypothetical protein